MKILFISHCILNLGSLVKRGEDQSFLKKRFLQLVFQNQIQLIQLPCPEFLLYGHLRWGHTKEQFLTPAFIRQCEQIAHEALSQVMEYRRFPEKFKILGFVGIDGSPT